MGLSTECEQHDQLAALQLDCSVYYPNTYYAQFTISDGNITVSISKTTIRLSLTGQASRGNVSSQKNCKKLGLKSIQRMPWV